MYKIYPYHKNYGYRETPRIATTEEETMTIVDDFLIEESDYDRCCVVKRENNTDTVHGVFQKYDRINNKKYVKKK